MKGRTAVIVTISIAAMLASGTAMARRQQTIKVPNASHATIKVPKNRHVTIKVPKPSRKLRRIPPKT